MSTSDVTTSFLNKNPPSSIAKQCIQRDLNEIETNAKYSQIIFVSPIDGNLLHLEAAIAGPMSTPYEGGVFLLDIKLSEQYPVK
jgi:ubiquitin-protein ligase